MLLHLSVADREHGQKWMQCRRVVEDAQNIHQWNEGAHKVEKAGDQIAKWSIGKSPQIGR